VASIDPIDTTVNGVVSYEVTMLLDREVAGLKPGMTATADAVVNRADRTLTVPRTAVRSPEGANPSVTVIGPGGRQELRLVATGVQDDSKVQILAGVGLGERVVRTIAAPPDPGMAQ
jgi:multidrug efflux pump subunit AcrA (membrane-fusion protein)